jgi:hypothetical protein
MTKHLEQVKSELARDYINTNYNSDISTELNRRNAYLAGFDSAISHLASVGVSGAREYWIAIDSENSIKYFAAFNDPQNSAGYNNVVQFIELLPVAAQIAKQAEEIEGLKHELQNTKDSWSEDLRLKDLVPKAAELMHMADKILLEQLKKQLAEAEKVIDYYAIHESVIGEVTQDEKKNVQVVHTFISHKARQYFKDKGE